MGRWGDGEMKKISDYTLLLCFSIAAFSIAAFDSPKCKYST
ncbi:hypothetical protein [Moorena sp. SIOASIH]|nr:hypothetical protein [Moorena sp. SIOASIH]